MRSGGIFYHYIAFKYQKTLWAPFKGQIEQWLNQWEQPFKTLVWIGSSAGYCLPQKWLEKFERIVVYETDPIARSLLRLRFRNLNLSVQGRDLLSDDSLGRGKRISTLGLKDLLSNHDSKETTVLFSNVLGQLPADFQTSELAYRDFCIDLTAALEPFYWASFHDRLSTPSTPKKLDALTASQRFLSEPTDLELIKFYYGENAEVEVTDHLTKELGRGSDPLRIWWQLTPDQFHLIEGITYSK